VRLPQRTLTQLREKHRQEEEELDDQLAALEEENAKLKKDAADARQQADKWRKMAECTPPFHDAGPLRHLVLTVQLCDRGWMRRPAAPAGEEDIASARTRPSVLEEEVRAGTVSRPLRLVAT